MNFLKKVFLIGLLGVASYFIWSLFLLSDEAKITNLVYGLAKNLSPNQLPTQIGVLNQGKKALKSFDSTLTVKLSVWTNNKTNTYTKTFKSKDELKLGIYRYLYRFPGVKLSTKNLKVQIQTPRKAAAHFEVLAIAPKDLEVKIHEIRCEVSLFFKKLETKWKASEGEASCPNPL